MASPETELPGTVQEQPEAAQEQPNKTHQKHDSDAPSGKMDMEDAQDCLPLLRNHEDKAPAPPVPEVPLPKPTGHQALSMASPKPSPREEKERGGLFTFKDPTSVKDQVRKAMEKKEPYSVFQYYKTDSKWSWLAMHPYFENTTLAVITFNAIYIAIDTDWNKDEPLTCTNTKSLTESGAFFQFMEHAFCFYFTFEWVTRFMSFEKKLNGLKDGWFIFDSLLVFMMVMETWVLLIAMAAAGGGGGSPVGGTSILRLFRLLRLSRLTRMLRSLPELMILIKGMVTAMKSVTYVFALLILFTYVFAIAFTQLAVGTESAGDVFHANISHSMYALLIHLTFLDDLSAYMEVIRYEIWPLIILSLIFIGLAALTLMNMLIGVLCEIVSAVAESERADMRAETLANNMTRIMKELDENRNGLICLHEFTNIVQNKDAINLFGEVGVDPLSIIDFAELFFYDDEGKEIELEFEGLMEVILDLRESNEATVKDMLNFWMKCKITTNADLSKAKKEFETLKGETDERIASMSAAQSRVNEQIAKIAQDLQRLSGNAPVAESAGG